MSWNRRDPDADNRTRRTAAATIQAVFASSRFDAEIEMLLAVGSACPFSHWRDNEIWLAEFYRAATERGYYS